MKLKKKLTSVRVASQRLENPGKTWKSLEYAIGTWKTRKIGRKSQKPGKNLEYLKVFFFFS